MLDGYRLVYPDSPDIPPQLWEWEEPHIRSLFKHAGAFRWQVVQNSFLDWDALAQENQRIWDTHYQPRPLYESWCTWQAWLAEYHKLVRDAQEIYEEHNGRRPEDQLQARQTMEHG